MADEFKLTINDDTAGGSSSVERNLDKIENAAEGVQSALNEAAQSAEKFDESFDVDAHMKISHLEGEIADLKRELHAASEEADDLADELTDVGKAGKKAGDQGGAGFKGMSLNVIGFNQALEIGKKGVEILSAAVNALADDGSPAFVRLRESVADVRSELLKLGNDPGIQDFADATAESIENRFIPVMRQAASATDELYRILKLGTLQAAEYAGMVEKGAAKQEFWQGKTVAAQKEEIADKREKILIDDKLAEIEKRIGEESELRNIAQSNSIRGLIDLIELEEESLREQQRAGTLNAKDREAGLKRIELAQRRLREVQKAEADAEIKEYERVAQVKIDEQKRFDEAVAAGETAKNDREAERLEKLRDEANAAADRLQELLAQAKGPKGGNLLDEARGGISAGATRAQLVKQAQEAARQKFIDENRGLVDLEGKASGWNDAERRANQRKADRGIALAQREAGIDAFRDFNAGKTSEADIRGAQDNLIKASAENAAARGQMDQSVLQALTSTVQNQQNQAATTQQLVQQVQQIQAALNMVGNTSRNTFANGRRLANLR